MASDPPHMFDPRTQLNYIVWHNDPKLEAFIRTLIDTVKPCMWIETGAHMGWTSLWIARNYPDLPVFTVEVDKQFYDKAKENLAEFPQVTVVHGHSPDFLKLMLPRISTATVESGGRPPIFWLDAHWWPPVPLREECRAVKQLDKYIALLDDFSVWEPDFSGDTFFSVAPSHGDAYLNDVSYVSSELGETYWRPCWECAKDGKGVGMFIKGTFYDPPAEYMKPEDMNGFIASRARSIARRLGEPGFVVYPLHPSSGRTVP